MISSDLRVEGFDARSWTNLVSLFAPPVRRRTSRDPSAEPPDEIDLEAESAEGTRDGILFLVVSARGRVRKAFHTKRGRVKGVRYDGPLDLERLAMESGARRAVAIREGTLEEIGQKIERRAARSDDYVSSWLNVLRAFREAIDEGQIHVWPRPMFAIPVPSASMVRRALDLVLPDETAMTLVVFEGEGLWTAAALRRRRGEIDWIAGPDLIAKWAGPLGGDWRRDHRAVSDAVARHVAPVHLGIFAEVEGLEELLRNRAPGAWAAAVAMRDVIVQPTPPYVAVALGADAMRAVAKRSADALGGIDALSILSPVLRAIRGRLGDVASVNATLGFDPLKVLAGWLDRSDTSAGTTRAAEPARPKKIRIEETDDHEEDEHETAFMAEVLPFPGGRRSSVPPPDVDGEEEAALQQLRDLAASDGEDE